MKHKLRKLLISCWFFFLSKKKKYVLLRKKAKRFYSLQRIAKELNTDGDFMSSSDYDLESYRVLGDFIIFCEILKIDKISTKLKSYSINY